MTCVERVTTLAHKLGAAHCERTRYMRLARESMDSRMRGVWASFARAENIWVLTYRQRLRLATEKLNRRMQ